MPDLHLTPGVIGLFVAGVLFYLLFALLRFFSGQAREHQERVQRRWHDIETREDPAGEEGAEQLQLLKDHRFSNLPWFDALLTRSTFAQILNRQIEQAGLTTPVGVMVLASLVGLTLGGLVASLFTDLWYASLGAGLLLGLAPYGLLLAKRSHRSGRFEAQLPDAMDLVGRALRAGHTFSSGMQLAADEFDEPLGGEFRKTNEEINAGLRIGDALDNLAERVDCPDLRFFVISVKIQSETGGNLAEIVESISRLIRERFKLKGRVKVLSAEGRMAAGILLAMPPGIGIFINFANPEYLDLLFTDDFGKFMFRLAVFLMIMGTLVIRKMVNIKV